MTVEDVAIQVQDDIQAYARTLDHGEALHCADHLAGYLWQLANRPGCTFHLARITPLITFAISVLMQRAARRHAHRPGGRPSFTHDDCTVPTAMWRMLDEADNRILRERGLIQ